ncbi:MAG: hypothetical protein EFKGCFLK_00001 [Rhodocyclaceae bacterium]|nr:hypothetical protein [Rhodocyclaceae bacterium]
MRGDVLFLAARGAQQSQHDGQTVADRQHRVEPAGKVALARRRLAMQPVVIGRQVEFADAAGYRGTALDAHQPVVLPQVMADLALHVEQRGGGLLDFIERAGKRRLGNVGVVAEGKQDLPLALEFLHEVELEVGAAGDIEDLEQRDQGDVVFLRPLRSDEVPGFVEQVLQAQQSANALVKRIFVGDHAVPCRRVNAANFDLFADK